MFKLKDVNIKHISINLSIFRLCPIFFVETEMFQLYFFINQYINVFPVSWDYV